MNKRAFALISYGILAGALMAKPGQVRPADPADLARSIDHYMQKAAANGYAGSILAARGEKIILAKGYGLADREKKIAQTAETVFSIGSITKQFTGAAILKLEMAGKLSVTDPIAKFFHGVPADKSGITLHQLLTHTAGLPDALGDDYESIGREAFLKRAMESRLLSKPGARYAYSNVGYSLLGIIIELVSGKGYEDYLREAIFAPAGMNRTGYLRPGFAEADLAVGYQNDERWGSARTRPWMADGPGWNLRANGGILSTVGDMHRWFLALRGEKVLSAAAKAKYFAPHVKEYADENSYYGYGWTVQKTGSGTTLIQHNGGNGIYNAVMAFIPETDFMVVASSNVAGKISDRVADRIRQMAEEGFRAMDEKLLAEYAGTYRLDAAGGFEVRFDENGILSASFASAPLVRLLSGTGRERDEETTPFDVRAKDALAGALNGDYKVLASAWGEPLDAVQKRAAAFWGGLTKRFGAPTRIEILGTVDRPRSLVTYARVDFARAVRFPVFIWSKDGGRLADAAVRESLEREFEPAGDGIFIVPPPIGAEIRFGRDEHGAPLLVIRKNDRDIKARKTGRP
jgi:CubicO group peptidase (beta-lactamase class C family)